MAQTNQVTMRHNAMMLQQCRSICDYAKLNELYNGRERKEQLSFNRFNGSESVV